MSGNGNQVPLAPTQRGPGPGHGGVAGADGAHSGTTPMSMGPQAAGGGSAQHLALNQLTLPQLGQVSLHLFNNSNSLKHDHSTSRYSNPNTCVPSHHYRLLAQARAECYHPSGAAGSAYMPAGNGGNQAPAQATLRVQPTPQQQPPQQQQQQQDMSKSNMPTHNFVPTQSQAQQARGQQYANYSYRTAQHGNRPTSHPRQQQPFIQGGAASGTGPVMYPTLVFPPMGMPGGSYPQQRGQGFYPYMTPLHYSYASTPPSHPPSYYYPSASSQPIQAPNLGGNGPGRTNASALVGPQGTPATPNAPSATMPHPVQTQTHMHQSMPGMRPTQQKRSHRLKIIDPVTRQDILSDISNDVSGDSSERQTPQPETTTAAATNSIAEEFTRMVNEVANQPSDSTLKSNYMSKNLDTTATTAAPTHPQTNAMSSINNNIVKSDILTVNENKSLGIADVAAEPSETPVVSAISDSPVIVPKLPTSIKQIQKSSDQIAQPLNLDTNKNIPKQQKQSKAKPVVPQEEAEKPVDNAPAPAPAPVVPAPIPAPVPAPVATPAPQPQRVREPRVRSSEEKDKLTKDVDKEKPDPPATTKPNGPTPPLAIISTVEKIDILPEVVKNQTSQTNPVTNTETTNTKAASKQALLSVEIEAPQANKSTEKSEPPTLVSPSATELLQASIEKAAKQESESKEGSSAIEAQAKLTQSLIASCIRDNQPESKMKDINLNNKTTDPDTANGNNTEATGMKTDNNKEDVNRNEKAGKNTKNMNKKSAKNASNDATAKEIESYENGKEETDKVSNVEPEPVPTELEETPTKLAETPEEPAILSPVFVPKYKYNDDQWSPLNMKGKKCYDLGLLKQIKDDPMSKNKPDIPILETCNVMRETVAFTPISRPMNDSLFPSFAKSGVSGRAGQGRDPKKDGRSIVPSGKGSVKLSPNPSGSGGHKPVIHVSLSLREDVKLNETENAWKPNRFKKETVAEEEVKTQIIYQKFRGILNKLTPQKFDTLMDKVKALEINNQKRLEGVIDLVFEKAIDEPNFSEAYANMCNKLYKLKVPADNATSPDQCVNFRALIISRCQTQFVTEKTNEAVINLEKELSECTDPVKRKELTLMLNEENRKMRMRSVGNVRFIGELYKLKMLTSKIMVYCMNHLVEKLEEEKLECLCKLLTTIGEQVEGEVREQLDAVFKKMQDIVDRKSSKISSRVRFMIQDVIALRRRRWVIKSVVDSQPKMMDQIQKEAEQHQRQIELMNSSPMSGGFRRDEGGRGKRGGDVRRQGSNSFMEGGNNWKTTSSRSNYSVDTSKLKAVTNKNLSNVKLAPSNLGWNYGSSTKNTTQAASNSLISLPTTTTNMYSVLAESNATDPTSLRGSKDVSSASYSPKGASIERSTFNSRGDFSSGSGSRSGSMGVPRSNSGSRSTSSPVPAAPLAEASPAAPTPPVSVPQEPLTEAKKKSVKSVIDLLLINMDEKEVVHDVEQLFPPQFHGAVVSEILNVVLEKSAKDIAMVSKALLHLVSSGTISTENLLAGLNEILEFAPDLYIDIPMLYVNFGKLLAPQIEKKNVTFVQILGLCGTVISSNHGHLFLRALIKDLKESMGPTFVKTKWQESGVELKEWMNEDQVPKFIEENKFEFLEGSAKASEETKKILSPAETQSKLLQLMNSDENCECIRGWVQDNLGKSSNEDWFMRSLIQAVCEHMLFDPSGRDQQHFNQDRMNKYSGLINEFGDSKQAREANCLIGIQQLIHRLEHPQGLTLEIFQYLHEQYLISVEGFIAWEESELEPEGKGVMMKALTSFFTNIKEADNEDSCSED